MRKRKAIYALSALLLLGGVSVVGLTSCGPSEPEPGPNPGPVVDTKIDGFTLELSGSSEIVIGETVNAVATSTTAGVDGIFTYEVTSGQDVVSVNDNGTITGLTAGEATITVTCLNLKETVPSSEATKTVSVTVTGEAESTNGNAYNYVASSYEEKLDILGKLEKYAVDNHLTGITLFENGGYVMYSDRIERPTNEYITGYGMGILSEGRITSDMEAETNTAWKRYYHSYGGTTNKQNFNYLDDTGSESADLYGYISSTYYGQKLNSNNTGYDWYPVLAKVNPETNDFMPQALNENSATHLATQYKVYVKTGKDGLVYNTLSTKAGRQSDFAGREVELEDYAIPFMLLLNGKIGLARNTDYTSDSNNATLKGARAFSDLTKSATDGGDVEHYMNTFYSLVGLQLNEEESSITFTFNTPVNQFTAMTNLSSTLNSPIPLDFIKQLASECGDTNSNTMYSTAMKDAYGTVNTHDQTYTPVDNVLSLAPYVLEEVSSTYNVYKRNPKWVEFNTNYEQYDDTVSSRYSIEGIKINYLQGAASDVNYAFNQFINAGTLDAVSIPKDYMTQYINDPRTTITEGDSTFKLNLNTATQAEWDVLFEESKAESPYTCKPLMSNDNFVNALSFAIDRETYATTRGSVPSQSYFAPGYLWEPEQGLSYDETAQHKAAIAEYSPETNGYNLDLAVQLMDTAITEEINKGNYSGYGDSETIDIYWMNTTDTQEYGNELVGYFNNAFTRTTAYSRGFRIKFDNHNGTTNYQDVYDRMGRGQFDLAFGSVSGMQLDPLGFMEVLKSDNTSGFTLNWGLDTSEINTATGNYINYDGKIWSFDGLWTAATKGALIDDAGKVEKDPISLKRPSNQVGEVSVEGEDGEFDAWDVYLQFTQEVQASGVSFKAFADASRQEDEYATVTITYTPSGSRTSSTVVLNANLGQLFEYDSTALTEDGTFRRSTAGFSIFVPKVLNENSTFGQVADNSAIDLSSCSRVTVTVYATYYMTINDVPVSTTLTTSAITIK